ncbi:PREDICTED: uncharacterized protein LOC105955595 isoform X2 [Erythranthe guttata]|uniref:uncharacterized protein LOC105955595 isoform X1 n=1 Tax=Erythranthe guttata TaxID=4155 RepID=UPI00064DB470|nr:PREDICTED: uncharacterized protein LOC105955595 isoform X1 [Erythranthe guttata]XP_012834803.1 PREDICTED: uncharacterized protein LOC105955595 isoform X2 [Erythranthe guttata]|eukprot:XP_012834802.1 PREDICTED: uncharacterized protein LOC105955595 isoform X1 [Erythranthe guttata]
MENGSTSCVEMVEFHPQLNGVSDSEEEKSRLRWLIDVGLRLGKKIVIAGFVITSAPLILPPLVVVSSVGFAFSVPFGVVFASYAFTQKLMSKLLPSPPLPLPYGGNEEEREEMEAVKNGIEFVDYDEGLDVGDGFEIVYFEEYDGGFVTSVEICGLNEEGIVEEESGDMVCFDSQQLDDYGEQGFVGNVEICGKRESGDEVCFDAQQLDDYGFVGNVEICGKRESGDEVRFDAPKLDDYGEDRELQGQSNVRSLEKGDDTLVENEGGKSILESIENEVLLQVQGGTSVENKSERNVSEKIEGEDLLLQVRGDTLVENEGGKNVPEKIETEDSVQDRNAGVEMTTVATVRVTDKDEKRRKGKRGKKKTLAAAFKLPEKGKEPEVDNRHEKLSGEDDKGVVVEKNKKNVCPKVVVKEESRDDKKQVGEEKCVVLEGENLDVKQVSLEKENEPVKLNETSDVTNGGTISYKSATVVVATETAEGNSVKIASGDSVEGMRDEEEIWKKIDAIRVIVGFKAPRRASYFEELKAMYIFTGIEPPSDLTMDHSSSDSGADFRNKLRFLMSVIGLK